MNPSSQMVPKVLKKERKQGMKPQSAKAKGRNLQKAVRDKILDAFPALTPEDVRSTSMGCGGMDLQLSTLAGNLFPFCVECKNVEDLQLWKSLEQAEINTAEFNEVRSDKSRPRHALLVFKKNNAEMFACIQHSVMADAMASSEAAQLGLIRPHHYQERINVWAKIDDAVVAKERALQNKKSKVSASKRRKEAMNTFTCTFARKNTPKYVVLSFQAFMSLLPLVVKQGESPAEAVPAAAVAACVEECDTPTSVVAIETDEEEEEEEWKEVEKECVDSCREAVTSSLFCVMDPVFID